MLFSMTTTRKESSSQPIRSSIDLGLALASLRKGKGWTQQSLAQKAGLRQATISRLENGVPGTTLETLLRVCAALGLDIGLTSREGKSQTIGDVLKAFR